MLLWVGSSEYVLPSQTAVTPVKISKAIMVPSVGAEFSSLCNTSLAQEALPIDDYECAVASWSSFTIFLLKMALLQCWYLSLSEISRHFTGFKGKERYSA